MNMQANPKPLSGVIDRTVEQLASVRREVEHIERFNLARRPGFFETNAYADLLDAVYALTEIDAVYAAAQEARELASRCGRPGPEEIADHLYDMRRDAAERGMA
jgi:hypothetical protein